MMRHLFWMLAIVLLFSANPALAGQSVARNYKQKLIYAERKRHYVVHVPNQCVGKKVPLVLLLHGGLTNAWFAAYESKMSEKADQQGFIVVYPQGTGGIGKYLLTWNAGSCCGPAKLHKSDDVGFVRSVIEDVQQKYEIDPDRIYVAGSSNGGMLAYRVATELSDVVAAVASVNGCLTSGSFSIDQPVSVLAFNGKKDRVIKMSGGVGSMLGYKIKCPPSHDTMRQFARQIGCNAEPDRETIGSVEKETYSGGRDGAEVCLYTVPIAHFWPGGRRPYPTFGRLRDGISATDVMCDFFRTHPKRRTLTSNKTP